MEEHRGLYEGMKFRHPWTLESRINSLSGRKKTLKQSGGSEGTVD